MLNKNCLKLLRALNKNPGGLDDSQLRSLSGVDSRRDVDYLAQNMYIERSRHKEIKNGTTYTYEIFAILPLGVAYLEEHRNALRNTWITRGISLVALAISIIALFKP